jgi:hypothetical protein
MSALLIPQEEKLDSLSEKCSLALAYSKNESHQEFIIFKTTLKFLFIASAKYPNSPFLKRKAQLNTAYRLSKSEGPPCWAESGLRFPSAE